MNSPKYISSLTNDRVKAIRALTMRKVRKETGLFVAEGTSLLESARINGFTPETIVFRRGGQRNAVADRLIDEALAERREVLEVSEAVLGKLASKENPQTILGVFRQHFHAAPEPDGLAKSETWLALEQIRDPGNLGTIVRTADAVGCTGIVLVGVCCDAYSPEVVRATMGSIFSVPLVRMESARFVKLAVRWPGDVVATRLDAKDDFRHVRYKTPALVVMGSEGPGLSNELAELANRRVKIPMAGELDSLNLAVATGLMLYQIRGSYLKV